MNILFSISNFVKEAFGVIKHIVTTPSEWLLAISTLYVVWTILAILTGLPHRMGMFEIIILSMVTRLYSSTHKSN